MCRPLIFFGGPVGGGASFFVRRAAGSKGGPPEPPFAALLRRAVSGLTATNLIYPAYGYYFRSLLMNRRYSYLRSRRLPRFACFRFFDDDLRTGPSSSKKPTFFFRFVFFEKLWRIALTMLTKTWAPISVIASDICS
mgnify:CR=1 FL=1